MKAIVPAGEIFFEGFVPAQSDELVNAIGGGRQIFIPYVDPSWIVK